MKITCHKHGWYHVGGEPCPDCRRTGGGSLNSSGEVQPQAGASYGGTKACDHGFVNDCPHCSPTPAASETPRTDAEPRMYGLWVSEDFARQLEKELTAAIDTKDMLWGQLQESRKQLAAAIQRANQYKSIAQEADAKAFNLVSKNEKLTARVKELEGLLGRIRNVIMDDLSIGERGSFLVLIDKAITTRTEGEG